MLEIKTETAPPEVILRGKKVLVVTASPWVGRVCVTMRGVTGVEPQLLQSMEEVTEQARETGFSDVDLLILDYLLPRTEVDLNEMNEIYKRKCRHPETEKQRIQWRNDVDSLRELIEENAGVLLLRDFRKQGIRTPAVLLFPMPSDFDQWQEREAEAKKLGAIALKIACPRQDLLKTCAGAL